MQLEGGKHRMPIVKASIGGFQIDCILDSGATISIIKRAFIETLKDTGYEIIGKKSFTQVNGVFEAVPVEAEIVELEFLLGDFEFKHTVLSIENMNGDHYTALLGYDFFEKYNVVINPHKNECRLNSEPSINIDKMNSKSIVGTVIEQPDAQISNLISSMISDKNEELRMRHVDLNNLNEKQLGDLVTTFREFSNIFVEEIGDLIPTCQTEAEVHLINYKPIYTRQYPIAHSKEEKLKSLIDNYLKSGIIEPSHSNWNSPYWLVDKPGGECRFVLDLRKLNQVTKKINFPLQRIDDLLSTMNGSTVFSTIDLTSGFFQIPLKRECRKYFAFSTKFGKFQMTRLAQGAVNSSFFFQSLMNETLEGLESNVRVFQDDVVIFSRNMKDHISHIHTVLNRLKIKGLVLRPSKSKFCQNQARFLGHIVSKDGIRPDPENVKAIENFQEPKNVKQVRSFLGMVNFYRKFIPNVSDVSAPLYELTKKYKKRFEFSREAKKAFDTLREILTSQPLLAHPDFSKRFYIKTDASDVAMGGVLEQMDGNSLRPIAYCARTFTASERNYSVVERECFSIIYTLRVFRPLVYGYEIQLESDSKPITFLATIKDTNQRLIRWALELQDYNLILKHIKGTENNVADFLSRHATTQSNICNLLSQTKQVQPFISRQEILKYQRDDKYCQRILEGCKTGMYPEFRSNDMGLLVKNVKSKGNVSEVIIIPMNYRNEILSAFHDVSMEGHFGYNKMRRKISKFFIWRGMTADIRTFVRSCDLCQQRKGIVGKTPLQFSKQPEYPFHMISTDLVGPLPLSKNKNKFLLVFVEQFTRFPIVIPVKNQEAKTIANAYVNKVLCEYGASEYICSDRGAGYTSELLREVCKLIGIKNIFTTPFNPQANSIAERFNATIVNTLAKLVNKCGSDWEEMLPQAIFAVRNAVHESTGYSPFFLLRGFDPLLPQLESELQDLKINKSTKDYVQSLMETFNTAHEAVKQNLTSTTLKRNSKYNEGRNLRVFIPGDLVLYYDSAVQMKRNRKFKNRFTGPYRIIAKLSDVTYTLRDVKNPKIVKNAHLNKLKMYYSRGVIKETPVISSKKDEADYNTIMKQAINDLEGLDGEEENDVDYLPVRSWARYRANLPVPTARQGDSDMVNLSALDHTGRKQIAFQPGIERGRVEDSEETLNIPSVEIEPEMQAGAESQVKVELEAIFPMQTNECESEQGKVEIGTVSPSENTLDDQMMVTPSVIPETPSHFTRSKGNLGKFFWRDGCNSFVHKFVDLGTI